MENNNELSVLAKRIRLRRELKNMSRSDLGDKLGFDGLKGNKNISKYENGTAKPSLGILVKLAKTLDCSTDYLIGLTDNPYRFTGDVDDHHYEVEIDANETDKPYSKEQFENLIRKLESIGIDVEKLMDK